VKRKISSTLFLESDEPLTLKDFRLTYSGVKEPVVNISDLTLAAGEITAITEANITYQPCLQA